MWRSTGCRSSSTRRSPRRPPTSRSWGRRSTTGPRAPRRAVRPARDPEAPTTWGSESAWSIQLGVEPFSDLVVVDAGDAPVVASRLARGAPRDPREGASGRSDRGAADRARRRPLDHVSVRSGGRPAPAPGDARHRALRRARRHRGERPRLPALARDPDAPAARGGVGRRSELRAGRPSRLLARPGDVRLDGVAGDALALDGRDRGARDRRGDRRRDRRGARRPGVRVTCRSTSTWSIRGWRQGAGTPERAAFSGARAAHARSGRIVGEVDLAGMDVVEVSPPYDQSEVTALLAYRVVMEAIGALAAKGRACSVTRPRGSRSSWPTRSTRLPEWVLERLENVEVIVEDRPPRDDPGLLGRYHGVPLTSRGSSTPGRAARHDHALPADDRARRAGRGRPRAG